MLSVVVTTSVHVEPHTPFWQVSPAPHATGLPHWPHASHVTVPVLLLLHCTWLLMKQTAGFGHEHAPHWQLWLHVSEDEQLRRFRAREHDPLKRWKLTGEDWRNLSRRADYERAVEEMLAETDHEAAPWHVVAAESKPYARLRAIELVIRAIERALRACDREPVAVEAAL